MVPTRGFAAATAAEDDDDDDTEAADTAPTTAPRAPRSVTMSRWLMTSTGTDIDWVKREAVNPPTKEVSPTRAAPDRPS